ncbi:helix-turn-helix transcriptional regulator [Paenibacillus sp. 481]|uniref:helix-turn-helix transcriptional regulator n=1 Tax=Paenibacillus sp. 481 TaxID=2835869 RepID=UPI001E5597B2|nr:WYL domain-containing protein [Paenibacillus sp. 481]
MHRIQWFDQRIRVGQYPNSNHLAEQFEISKRQAQRDIEYMAASLRAPLQYVAKYRGYSYEDKTYVLPLVYMTEEEKKILKYLAYRYRQYNYENAATVQRIAYLLDRFTDEQEVEMYKQLPMFKASPMMIQYAELFSQAIQQRMIVQITYKEQTEETRLRIYPLKLVSHFDADYVVAYCEQQHRQRSFQLDYIQQATVTNLNFAQTASSSETTNAQAAYVAVGVEEIAQVRYFNKPGQTGQSSSSLHVIRSSHAAAHPLPRKKPFVAKIVLAQPHHNHAWHGYPIRHMEGSIYEMEFHDADLLVQQLVISEWEELISPKWLKQKLQRICSQVIAKCSPD